MPTPPRLIAVIGAKGGCGATLVAVNFAGDLVTDSRGRHDTAVDRRVLLVDLDFSKGDVAAWLGRPGDDSLCSAIDAGQRLDKDLLAALVVRHDSGLHLLLQPNDLADLEQVSGDGVAHVLDVARASYKVVVADCGSRVDPATLTAALRADVVMVVLTPRLMALRNAMRLQRLFDRLQVPARKIVFVESMQGSEVDIDRADIEEQLGVAVTGVLGQDEEAAALSEIEGRLLRRVSPGAHLTEDIERLVDRVFFGIQLEEAHTRRRFWQWRRKA